MENKYYIAITGSSGSGKSTVLHILGERGYAIRDYDKYAVDVIKKSKYVQLKLQKIINEQIVFNGKINLKKVGDYFENHREKEIYFEKWFQPILGYYIKKDILKDSDERLCFFDVPFLKEKGIIELFQEVWIIRTDFYTCCERVQKRNQYSHEKAKYLVARSIVPINSFTNYCIIENDFSIDALHYTIEKILKNKRYN